jgi:ADP-ribose pyrophosphatase YjhB (NUDIX family)
MKSSAPIPAVSVVLHDGGAFLLVKRARAPSKGLYAFPGGRVEAGESLHAAAMREVEEETGLSVSRLRIFEEIILEGEKESFLLSVFLGKVAGGTARAGDDAEEIGWFRLGDMEALPVTPSTLATARRIAAGSNRK